ncbi:MAG: class I SAM-dependent methyltransferase [Bdellovibrionota bacterium]
MKNKTWNEFWGEFLQVTFHKGNPELWPARERKALWAKKHFQLNSGAAILDLGCGDGMLDVWLSRMGYKVTAADRNSQVLEIAKSTDDTNKVNFISVDLKDIKFQPESFDAVLFIEALGLMSKEEEFKLFKNIHSWLRPGGKFILDCPETVELKNSWSKDFPNGIIRGVSGFNETSRVQDIQFYFKPNGEDEFGIYDPYDLGKGDVAGIMRYLYPKEEISKTLEAVGFKTQEIGHYYEKNYFGLLCTKDA